MGIVKELQYVTITFPDNHREIKFLNEYKGLYTRTETGIQYIKSVERYNAVKNGQMLAFDCPSVGISQTWKFDFYGKYHEQDLPPIYVRVEVLTSGQINMASYSDRVDGVLLYDGLTFSGMGHYPYEDGKWYFAIGMQNINTPTKRTIFLGLNTWSEREPNYNCLIPFGDGTEYFNDTKPIEYNPTYGTPEDPEKFESKPNDASEATLDDTSDIIVIDSLPSAVFAGGLFRIYELNNTQMTTLSNELTDPSIIEALVRTVTSPLDYVVSLKAMPATFEGFSTSLRLGNYTSTGVGNVKQINNFLFDIDCGSVTIPKYFDSFLDWSPYTNATIYLPFVGYVSLNLDKFIGDSVIIKYRVDAVSGDCIAFVSNTTGLIATYSGNCAYNLPLRANDASAIVAGLYSALSGLTTGNGGQFTQGAFQLTEGVYKPNMVSTSGLSANAGSMCNRKPYLIVERPHVSMPKTYPQNIGYMCRISAKLSDIHGYTEVEAIHLDNVIATREEKAELEALLRNGVVLP